MQPSREIARLLEIMAALRDPETGCAWDIRQTFATIAPYTIEEAHEVAEAISRNDLEDLREELGDLLLQVVFHARIAEEAGAFDFGGVVEAITRKLIRRHPHVFGDSGALGPEAIRRVWSEIKQAEKAERRARRGNEERPGLLDDVPAGLPALARADKLTRRAATVGFDWPDAAQVVAKVREELAEVEEAADGGDPKRLADEIGDLLFAAANLARHHGVDPEAALRGANEKFMRRFRAIETGLAQTGRDPADASLDEMEAIWIQAKQAEKN
ncbi:MAG: nucleoside triphosphate pyrophosphohydrolase [Salinarimonadaceae bacterium]|nr:MAG: nucleoside triphosphate pyrophosphohydrolase [Salinarimonadaceae bacterium]